MKLSQTAQIILSSTAQHGDRLVRRRPKALPVVDLNICRALVKQGLLEVVHTPTDTPGLVSVREAGNPIAYIIADAGYRVLNLEPPRATEPSPPNLTLRQAAAAVLESWASVKDHRGHVALALTPSITLLTSILATRQTRAANATRKPRGGTKQQAVLDMLRRTEGTTIAQVMETTGWASHTVHGFFAGLKKKGFPVAVLQWVRQTGKEGAKGSYSIYVSIGTQKGPRIGVQKGPP